MCTQTLPLTPSISFVSTGLRFKIEHTFKQAVRQIGSFTYHFWMSNMKAAAPQQRQSASPSIPRSSTATDVKRKLHAYHVLHPGRHAICQGLLQ